MSTEQNELPIISTRKSRNTRRTISFFTRNYNFPEPFKVLVDWLMVKFMSEHKITVQDISRLLLGRPVDFRVTRCTLDEIEKSCVNLGIVVMKRDLYPKLIGCPRPHTIDSKDCIHSMVANDNHLGFFVAVGEDALWRVLIKMAGVPVISNNGSELIFKKPSFEQKQFAKEAELRRETPAREEQQKRFRFVSESDRKLEQEAFELEDGETLYKPDDDSIDEGLTFVRKKRKVKGKSLKLSYAEDDSIDEDLTFVRKKKYFTDENDECEENGCAGRSQRFTDGKDSKDRKSNVTAGSSKYFTDEDDECEESGCAGRSQRFTDGKDSKDRKSNVTAGSSKYFTDEDDECEENGCAGRSHRFTDVKDSKGRKSNMTAGGSNVF